MKPPLELVAGALGELPGRTVDVELAGEIEATRMREIGAQRVPSLTCSRSGARSRRRPRA